MSSLERSPSALAKPGEIRQYLHEQGLFYLPLSSLEGVTARIRFPGRYQGKEVVWDACLYALNAEENTYLRPQGVYSQFMEISVAQASLVPIVLGIAESSITPAVAYRAVIMVQNYKGLRDGRYEYGAQV